MYRLHTVHTVHSMHFCYKKSLLLMIIQIKSILFNCGDSSVKVKVTVFERFIQLGKMLFEKLEKCLFFQKEAY